MSSGEYLPQHLLERIDLDVQSSKKEIDRLWRAVGNTREELVALRGDTQKINATLQEFRSEVREATDRLSASSSRLDDTVGSLSEVINKNQGRREGVHAYCRTSILVAGVIVAFAGVMVALADIL